MYMQAASMHVKTRWWFGSPLPRSPRQAHAENHSLRVRQGRRGFEQMQSLHADLLRRYPAIIYPDCVSGAPLRSSSSHSHKVPGMHVAAYKPVRSLETGKVTKKWQTRGAHMGLLPAEPYNRLALIIGAGLTLWGMRLFFEARHEQKVSPAD